MITKKQAVLIILAALFTFGGLQIYKESKNAEAETTILPQDVAGARSEFFYCTGSGCENVTAAVRAALEACSRNTLPRR